MNDFILEGGRYWRNKCAPHLCKKVTSQECSEMLGKGGLFIINTYNFDCGEKTHFYFVIKDKFVGLEELSSKVRNQVRKSLKTYDVEKVTGEEIARIGLEISNKAWAKYCIKERGAYTKSDFDRFRNAPSNWDFFCVYTKKDHLPVAYAVNVIENECCVGYNILKADPAYQHNSTYPYYGLIYEMNRYYLEEKGMLYVNDGSRSLSEHSNIQPFLIEKFNFRKAYCQLQVEYKWWFGFLVKMLVPFRKICKSRSFIKLIRLEMVRRGQY